MPSTPLIHFKPAVVRPLWPMGLQTLRRAPHAVRHLPDWRALRFLIGAAALCVPWLAVQAQPAVAAKPMQPAREWVTPAAGNAQQGAALYQSLCTACHAVDSNQTGPAHRGVVGRRVGSLPGYTYSAELARSRLRWTPQTLNVWLQDPEELVAGQRMGFQVDDAQQRADLIAYLATLK